MHDAVLVLGSERSGMVIEALFRAGYTPLLRNGVERLLERLQRGRFAAVLVDRGAVQVDVLELMLNVRDINADIPVVVVGEGSENVSDEAFLSLPGTTMIGGANSPEKMAETLGEVLAVRKTQDG